MLSGWVTAGSGLVSTITPVTVNVIVSSADVAFASRIACLSDPAPESFKLVTVKDAP